jgi:hypothetical protein
MLRQRSRFLLPIAVLTFFGATIFMVPKPPVSHGQERIPSSRKPSCGCYVCGRLLAVNFPNKAPNCAGILATDACPVEMAELPVEQRRAFCKEIKERSVDKSLDGCLNLRGACEDVLDDPPGPDCGKSTPWFDRSTECTDVQSPVVKRAKTAVTVSMCGFQIFSGAPEKYDDTMLAAYEGLVKDWIKGRVGSKICCSSMLNASRTGKPCDPAKDIDCDGRPNQSDIDSTSVGGYPLPDINLTATSTGADIDPYPAGFDPNDPDFRPERTARNSKGVGDCPCKWELIRGDLKCGAGGNQSHVYTATWRCPITKAEVTTIKETAATTPCSDRKPRTSLTRSLSESLGRVSVFYWPK